jgi:2-isopropylmalate synthase
MYDWNQPDPASWRRPPRVVDETLRDGLQSASTVDPPLDRKLAILHTMAAIGVDFVSLGLPAAGPRARADVLELAREVARSRLRFRPTAAARTTEADVRVIAEVSQAAGVAIDVYAFIGCSPIRRYVEGWSEEWLLDRVRTSAEVARRANLTYCLVMEDTTRTPPETVRAVFGAALEAGATRVCVCDTVGHADPRGATNLVAFARSTLASLGAPDTEIDWHGHNDRGLALGNAIAAARAGATGVHGSAGGVGERTGNVPIEHLVVQLAALSARPDVPGAALDAYRAIAVPDVGAAPRQAPREETPVRVRMRVNGEAVDLFVKPSRTLLEVLRYDLDLVATKQGCDEGECGACTVLLDGTPVLACLTLAAACGGHDVVTPESLSGEPALDPLLDAFDRTGAGQCGFCTSGMLMSAKALLAREPRPSRDQIKQAISGNLCRCTGYGTILDAIEIAAGTRPAPGDAPRPGQEHLPKPLPPYPSGAK